MKILFIAPYAPGHIRVRSFHLLLHLLDSGHRVTLAYPHRANDQQSRVDQLKALGAEVVSVPIPAWRSAFNSALALLSRRPMQARYAWSPTLARRLRTATISSDYDVVHVEHLRAITYARFLDRQVQKRAITVWDSVDCVSSLLQAASRHSRSKAWRLAARLDLRPTRRLERAAVQWFDRVLVTSTDDRRALEDCAGEQAGRGIEVLPGGIDLEAFPYRAPDDRQPEVVFSGALGYHPNTATALHLVESIMPLVWARRADVRLVIVGPDAPRRLQRASTTDGVRMTGWVPSVQPHLAAAAAAAIPMRYGTGVQNKALEAMACGTPVVSDPRTAAAVGAESGKQLLVARTDGEFADAILRLLTEPALRLRIATSAREHVENHFPWPRIGDELERHYRSAIAAKR